MEKQTEYKNIEKRKYLTFGHRLKHAMFIRNKQNNEVAKDLFVSPSAVSGYRSGRRSPDVEQLAKLARELHVSADYLLGLCDDDSNRTFSDTSPDLDIDLDVIEK